MWSSPVVKPVALFQDKSSFAAADKQQASSKDKAEPKQKQDLASWKAKRDRWMGSPRPRLKPLPTSSATTSVATLISPKKSNSSSTNSNDSLSSTEKLGLLSLDEATKNTTLSTAPIFGSSSALNTSSASSTTTTTTSTPSNPFGNFLSSKPVFGTSSISTSTSISTSLSTSTSTSLPKPTQPANGKPKDAKLNPFKTLNLVASSKALTASNTTTTPPPVQSKPSNSNLFGGSQLVAPPKPLAAQQKAPATNKLPSSSSSYPPMSSAAPKNPFGGKTAEKTTKPKSASSSSSSYPPMSSAAPKNPFGATATKPTPSSSSTAPKDPFQNFQYQRDSRARLEALGLSSTSAPTPTNNHVDYKTKLIQFYEKHNPSKMDTVDATLQKYKGKEDELFRKLQAKYTPKPTTPAFPPPSGDGPNCYLEFKIGNDAPFRVVVKLYKDKAPLAAENFRCFCTGEITTHKAAGKHLRYLKSKVHRIVPGFCIQGGDFTTGNGRGGASIYAPNSEHGDAWGKFKDEPTGFLNHSKKGLLSMANSGKNTNSSQFFFTLKAVPYLNGKHVVFGEVQEGMEHLEKMSKVETNKAQKPMVDVVISACGEIDASGKDVPSLGSGESGESSKSAFAFASKAPMFGSSSSSSAFGTTPSPFGKPSSSPFGGSNSSSAKNSTGASPFSTFSSAKPSGSASGGLGSSSGSTPAFGAPKASSAAIWAGPAFGSPSALGGSSNITAKTAAPVFGSPSALGGSSNTPAFGSGSSSGRFGALAASAPKTSASVFGSTTFGGTSGTTASGGFGSLATSAKGSAPAFGSSKPSAFGGAQSAFGSNVGNTKGFSFGGSK